MIRELLGAGAGLLGGDRKNSMKGGVILQGNPSLSSSPSPSPSISPPSTITAAAAATATKTSNTNPDNQNLRCPRCDSANTKFCYYNNYNLTQPRHFCKTCRRYWTKGGALRNVPIGGGCRKNRSSGVALTTAGKSSNGGKAKTLSPEILKSSLGRNGFDHEIQSNPILWPSPQNSHILTLLRATQNHNSSPNPLFNSFTVEDEGLMMGSPHMNLGSGIASNVVSGRTLGLDPMDLCSSFWRNNNQSQIQNHHQDTQQNGFIQIGDEVKNSGIQDMYQRLRSPASNYYSSDHAPVILGHVPSSSTSSAILESAPVGGSAELGYWNNPSYSWSDLPTTTTNGAYP